MWGWIFLLGVAVVAAAQFVLPRMLILLPPLLVFVLIYGALSKRFGTAFNEDSPKGWLVALLSVLLTLAIFVPIIIWTDWIRLPQ